MNIEIIHTKNLRWIDIKNPGEAETDWLKQNFKLHRLHFQAVREHQLRPRIDQGAGYSFIVLLFPVYHQPTQEILPGEIDFFIGDRFLLTVHYDEIFTLKKFFNEVRGRAQLRSEIMNRGSGYLLYKILESLFRRSYPVLDHMDSDVRALEQIIFHETNVDMLSNIALMKKNIIEFRKMIKTHRYVLEKLPEKKTSYLTFPQSKIYYRDLFDYSQNIWDILEALKETVDTLQDTTQVLAAHRLNKITKVISIFSAIVIPATLIAFLFGVAVESVPLRHHPYGFWIIAGIMAASSILLLLIFKAKKWL